MSYTWYNDPTIIRAITPITKPQVDEIRANIDDLDNRVNAHRYHRGAEHAVADSGTNGFMAATDFNKLWGHVEKGGNVHPVATRTMNGFMSSSDYAMLHDHVGSRGNAHAVATAAENGFMDCADKAQLDKFFNITLPSLLPPSGSGGSGSTGSGSGSETPPCGAELWTTPGVYTWKAPRGDYVLCTVTVIGAGGGGGGGDGSCRHETRSRGGIGGPGGRVFKAIVKIPGGESITITVGNGGIGGSPDLSGDAYNNTPGGTGAVGGASSFGGYVVSYGGAGGSGAYNNYWAWGGYGIITGSYVREMRHSYETVCTGHKGYDGGGGSYWVNPVIKLYETAASVSTPGGAIYGWGGQGGYTPSDYSNGVAGGGGGNGLVMVEWVSAGEASTPVVLYSPEPVAGKSPTSVSEPVMIPRKRSVNRFTIGTVRALQGSSVPATSAGWALGLGEYDLVVNNTVIQNFTVDSGSGGSPITTFNRDYTFNEGDLVWLQERTGRSNVGLLLYMI